MSDDRYRLSSRQVSFWRVVEFVAPALERVGAWPMAGTPEWCELPADDPRKLAALLDAARHHALRMEIGQEAQCQASQAISAAYDWAAIGREIRDREKFYRERPWLRRTAV